MKKKEVEKILKATLAGEVRFDDISRKAYSTDASIYEIVPMGVVFPKTRDDIIQITRVAAEFDIPVIPRGAATGITGGCLGNGIIVDTSKYLNHIPSLNPEAGFAVCEPGVIQDDLNRAIAPMGLRLGPDTSTGNRATIGGMLANNAAGSRSLRYGCMAEHVDSVELVLAGGSIEKFSSVSLQEWQEMALQNKIYSVCWELRQSLSEEIRKRFPSLPRRVSGYDFPHLITEGPFNLCRLIAGSEGSLGIAAEIKLRLSPLPQRQVLCLIKFESLNDAFEEVMEILSFQPMALEVIDQKIIEAGRKSLAFKNRLDWLPADVTALLIVEFEGEAGKDKAEELSRKFFGRSSLIESAQTRKDVWELRKGGLGLLMSKRSFTRAIAFLEDVSVPPEKLTAFMNEFLQLLGKNHKHAGIYGHAGAGCMHIRPYMDLRSSEDRNTMIDLMRMTTGLLLKYQGALSGEHGDGLIRSWLNEELFGKKIYQGFVKFKQAFDPRNLMNPHKIVEGLPVLDSIRKSPEEAATFLDFSREGGIALAVDMCNGNGQCRKKEGIMCPSFQATLDENDTTRARANLLRGALTDKTKLDNLSDQGVHDILDLCLSCKGCKSECPSQIDMAKLKAEALYHYQKKHGIPLRARLFGNIGKLFAAGAPIASLANFFTGSYLGKKGLGLLGISDKRTLPKLARQTFEAWVSKQPIVKADRQVVLFNDTFTNFVHPEIGIAAFKLFQALGYSVIVPSWNCCGRPALSKGLLPKAKKSAEKLTNNFSGYAGIPLVVLEPSCLSALIDDYHDLIPGFAFQAYSLEEFLLLEQNLSLLSQHFQTDIPDVCIHVHCHQKALLGIKPTQALLSCLPGIKPLVFSTGCCGMAGSFGFEKEHEEISQRIGELSLFPSIRNTAYSIPILSNGTSCRSHIQENTNRHSLHLVEYIFANFKG